MLTSLSDTVDGFTDHLFAVSSVSGGSLGAVTYRALLVEPSASGKLRQYARETLAYDALAPTIAAFTQQDLLQRFLFPGFLPDRAKALEEGWELGWTRIGGSPRLSRSFLATAQQSADALPSLFLNGTIVETGQRTITSNVRITGRFADATDALESIGGDVRVSTAAHNSARFPYVSPVGTMIDRHVADGGYFENSGAGTAADLVEAVRRHADFRAGKLRPYVIVIDTRDRTEPIERSRFGLEIIAPLTTLLGTRGAHARAEVAEVRENLPGSVTHFTLIEHEGQRFPLGWLLAARTRDQIDLQMGLQSGENGQHVKDIANVLGVTPRNDTVWQEAWDRERLARRNERK